MSTYHFAGEDGEIKYLNQMSTYHLRQVSGIEYLNQMSTYHFVGEDGEIT